MVCLCEMFDIAATEFYIGEAEAIANDFDLCLHPSLGPNVGMVHTLVTARRTAVGIMEHLAHALGRC